MQELDPTLWLHKTLQLVSKLVSSSAKNGGFVRLQWWPQFMQTAQSNGRGKYKPELKIKWYFSCWTFAEGLLQGRAFYSHGMEREKKKKRKLHSHASLSNVVGLRDCTAWTRTFSLPAVHGLPVSWLPCSRAALRPVGSVGGGFRCCDAIAAKPGICVH